MRRSSFTSCSGWSGLASGHPVCSGRSLRANDQRRPQFGNPPVEVLESPEGPRNGKEERVFRDPSDGSSRVRHPVGVTSGAVWPDSSGVASHS